MLASSPLRYVRSEGGQHIAYRTFGAAERDFCVVLPSQGTSEMLSEPPASRLVEGFTDRFRVISFDRRGNGLSDPLPKPPTLEEQMTDVLAVLNACGSERTVIAAETEGTMLAVLFAATYPDRVSHLVLFLPMARATSAPGYEWGWADAETRRRQMIEPLIARWGTGENGVIAAPIMAAANPDFPAWWGRWERLSASPGTAAERMELISQMDVRAILPRVQAPTLVLCRPASRLLDRRHVDYVAERIPGAELRELPGRDGISFGDGIEHYIGAVTEFTGGAPAAPRSKRALATVMFTDIVGSTRHAAALGDEAWLETLERHDRMTRDLVAAYGGRAIKSTGDGFLATFDGPARAVRCATALGARIGELGIELRAGLHAGEIELVGSDVGGMAVHIGARIGELARAGRVLVSSTVRDLVVGSGIEFADAGEHELRNVPGRWRVYSVERV